MSRAFIFMCIHVYVCIMGKVKLCFFIHVDCVLLDFACIEEKFYLSNIELSNNFFHSVF